MILIFSKFLNLDQEKRERIINASLKEFAQKGYEKASTNEIVKEANISKGLLFHYFNKKKDLFLFLYDYCIEILLNEFFKKIDVMEKDILIRLREMTVLKFALIQKHPEMFDFIMVAYQEESDEVKEALADRNKGHIATGYKMLFAGFDVSKFREGMDIPRAIEIISWTLEGFSKKQQEKIMSISLDQIDYESILAELDLYIEVLKKCFYK